MKIAVISDLDFRGSGYMNITLPLCEGLSQEGHDIKAVGLAYKREEHWFNFSILPADNFQEMMAIVKNLEAQWKFDVLIVAIDITWHEQVLSNLQDRTFKYVGIMPIEADPLCLSWAMILMQMDKVFIISEFGSEEAQKQGIEAEHILVGIDSEKWKFRNTEDRVSGRGIFGFEEDDFVVLTVADNQERKNLSKGMEIFAEFSKSHENVKYVLVTREHLHVGWKLQDYAQELDIQDKMVILERGMPQKKLWSIYAMADVFLLPSKAEGLGLPILESMAVGIPVIGTNCTAIRELICQGGGFVLDYEEILVNVDGSTCSYRDPFGNGARYIAEHKHGVSLLENVYNLLGTEEYQEISLNARDYIESRDWSIGVEQLDRALRSIQDEDSDDSSDEE